MFDAGSAAEWSYSAMPPPIIIEPTLPKDFRMSTAAEPSWLPPPDSIQDGVRPITNPRSGRG